MCVCVSTEGVGCMDIALSDEPNLGTWTVDAHLVMVSVSCVDTVQGVHSMYIHMCLLVQAT